LQLLSDEKRKGREARESDARKSLKKKREGNAKELQTIAVSLGRGPSFFPARSGEKKKGR